MIPSPVSSPSQTLDHRSTLVLARILAESLSIAPFEWHRLKAIRTARAAEHILTALVLLLDTQPEEARPRLPPATGCLDRSISAPPCPSHGHGH
ncbi:MAG: DUF6439 family protein [bacterium]